MCKILLKMIHLFAILLLSNISHAAAFPVDILNSSISYVASSDDITNSSIIKNMNDSLNAAYNLDKSQYWNQIEDIIHHKDKDDCSHNAECASSESIQIFYDTNRVHEFKNDTLQHSTQFNKNIFVMFINGFILLMLVFSLIIFK